MYVAESAISSGAAGAAADGSENTAAIAGGLALVFVAGVSSILIQVGKNQPPPQATVYSGPPLSYYVAKFQPSLAAVALQQQPAVDAPATEDASSPAPASPPPPPQRTSSPPELLLLQIEKKKRRSEMSVTSDMMLVYVSSQFTKIQMY